jgi:zinc transport system substrate-binding protein
MKTLVSGACAAALVLSSPLVAGCEKKDASHTIVTSLYPLQYVAQRVAGDHFTVTNLTKPGQEPHDTEVAPSKIAELSSSALVVYVEGLSGAVDDAVKTADPKHVIGEGLAPSNDPHIWLNPATMATLADRIGKQLATIDPDHRADYAANSAKLIHDLHAVTGEYERGLAHCTIGTIVVTHDAYEQLPFVGRVVSINGLSPDAEPSPAHIKELHDLIQTDHVTTVFTEPLASPVLADSLARDLGIKTAVLDPIEGLTEATKNEDYLSLMRQNLSALEKAKECS